MPEDVKACPLCGSAESSLFDRRSFHQQDITNRLCKSCGLVYQSPRMSEAELEGFYQAEYRRQYQGREDPVQKDVFVQRRRAEAALEFVHTRIQGISRHLDIGCSAGLLLQRFQRTYTCQPYGVEPGTAYREYARQQGLVVYASLEQLSAETQGVFDFVSMMHVLEHVPDPVSYLVWLREKYLDRAGWLLLEVPNLFGHDSFETAHLVSFSPHTLAQAVQKAGFAVTARQIHGLPRSQIIPLYVRLLAKPDDRNAGTHAYKIWPERNTVAKRRFGMLYRNIASRLAPQKAWLPIGETIR
jgi:2-polyprenyl-3-methyl-5-hydroxy-6-metoxy-1,4-benzoquinol methylase